MSPLGGGEASSPSLPTPPHFLQLRPHPFEPVTSGTISTPPAKPWCNFHPPRRSLTSPPAHLTPCRSLSPRLAVKSSPPFPGPSPPPLPPLPPPASAPPALPSKVSPRRSPPPARLARSRRPRSSGSASGCRGPGPRHSRPASHLPPRAAAPPSPEQLKVSVTSRGAQGEGRRGSRGGGGGGGRGSLDDAARDAAGGRRGLGRPPARPLPKVPPPGRAPAAAVKSFQNVKEDWRSFISLCARGWDRIGAAGPGAAGPGAPPGAERSATKDAPRRGRRPRGPTLRAAPAPPGRPPAALRTGRPGTAGAGGFRRRRCPRPPDPQERDPGLPGGGGRPSCPRKVRALPRMPLALARGPRARHSGPCGGPGPRGPSRAGLRWAPAPRPSPVPSFFSPVLSRAKGHT